MATTKTSYSVISLEEAAPAAAQRGFGLDTAPDPDNGRRGRVSLRRDLDIGSFGVNAFYQGMSGAWVVGEHDELGPGASGHEELYVVVAGSLGPGESVGEFYRLYRDKDYEGALSACREGLEEHPGNAMILYNVACLESLLGHPDEALEPLAESLAAWPAYREQAAADDDLAALRDDPRFQALVA